MGLELWATGRLPREGQGALRVYLDFHWIVCQIWAICHAYIREVQGILMHVAGVQKHQLLAAVTVSTELMRKESSGQAS